ncbi:MAG: DNA polymerase/3'-5' exonuclease PolX [Thermotogota bacterium]|nr:DNA polymerase/3'-5' exonuclease PolX [Thermotogota bacterium]
MKNRKLAEIFNEMADILEFQNVQWKPRAYRSAARRIKNLDEDVEEIYKEHGKKGLSDIEGIGKSLAEHIADYLEEGTIKKYDELKKEVPEELSQLLSIEGLGPSKVRDLVNKLGVKNIDDLKKAINEKEIRKLEGFGEKTEENILKSLEQYELRHKRMRIDTAMNIATEIIEYLKEKGNVKKIDYAGSLRRMKETIGDIDILTIAPDNKKVMKIFADMSSVSRVQVKGDTKTTVELKEGVDVDLRVVPEKAYGAALLYFTGSKDHNIQLRKIAIDKNYKLSEYGLFEMSEDGEEGKWISGKSEEEVYKSLDLAFIPPELRENRGEIKQAKDNKIPNLITVNDYKGDLHMHTKYSDGAGTIDDMLSRAEELGYEYVAISDHSVSERIANGLSIDRLKEQWEEIDKISKNYKIKILKSAEVDILPDGSLDYPEEVIKEMDLVIAAIHSRFKSSEDEMTSRIIKAFETGNINIFAHPTGRMIGKREGYNVNMKRLFKAASDNNVVLEINSDPNRLDLNDVHILQAKKYGVKFAIDTDSHSPSTLKNIMYGIGIARRGWLEPKDVINTMSWKELKTFLKGK